MVFIYRYFTCNALFMDMIVPVTFSTCYCFVQIVVMTGFNMKIFHSCWKIVHGNVYWMDVMALLDQLLTWMNVYISSQIVKKKILSNIESRGVYCLTLVCYYVCQSVCLSVFSSLQFFSVCHSHFTLNGCVIFWIWFWAWTTIASSLMTLFMLCLYTKFWMREYY